MALAIGHIHGMHILHRDIKLANILMTKEGQIKVGDFGLARTLEHTAQLAQTACGTPYYISPELCHGTPYGKASDVWAMGCSLYELMALKRHFDGQNLTQTLTLTPTLTLTIIGDPSMDRIYIPWY